MEPHPPMDLCEGFGRFEMRLIEAGATPAQIAEASRRLDEICALGALWRNLWRVAP